MEASPIAGAPSHQTSRATISSAAASTHVALASPATAETSSTVHRRPRRTEPNGALHDIVAGGIAGSAGFLVGHPLDSLKVRLQMTNAASLASSSSSATPMAPHAFRNLMRGAGAPVTTAAALNASIFLTYGGCTRAWEERFGTSSEGTKWAACGFAAGVASAFTMCPAEHVKTKLQTQGADSSATYKNSWDATRRILSSHGVDGLFRGYAATLARQGPGFVVYFSVYERMKLHFGSERSLMESVAAGGLAGSVSWASVYPVDFVKSRIQALPLDCSREQRSMAHVAREVIRDGGLKALYRGFGVTVLRAFPVNAVIFPTHDLLSKAFREH